MNASFYVPTGTKEVYKARDGWKYFVWIEERDYTNVVSPTQSAEPCKSFLYTIDGKRTDKYSKGIRIVKFNNGATKKVLMK